MGGAPRGLEHGAVVQGLPALPIAVSRRHLSPGPRRVSGVTLIELLIATLVLTLVMAGVSAALLGSWQSQRTIVTQNDVRKSAEQAVDAMADDLRSSYVKDSYPDPNYDAWKWPTGGYTTAASGQTSAWIQIRNPRCPDASYYIQYWLDGQQLKKKWKLRNSTDPLDLTESSGQKTVTDWVTCDTRSKSGSQVPLELDYFHVTPTGTATQLFPPDVSDANTVLITLTVGKDGYYSTVVSSVKLRN